MVSQTIEKYPELHGCFNKETILAAVNDGVSDVEAFALYIRGDIGNYRMNSVNKRYQELMM